MLMRQKTPQKPFAPPTSRLRRSWIGKEKTRDNLLLQVSAVIEEQLFFILHTFVLAVAAAAAAALQLPKSDTWSLLLYRGRDHNGAFENVGEQTRRTSSSVVVVRWKTVPVVLQ
jgi:hypothetical protein